MDPITLLVTLGLTAEIALAVYATWRIAQWHKPVKGQAHFLDRLVARDTRVSIAGAVIGFVVIYSLVRFAIPEWNLPPLLVAPIGALIVGGVLAVLLWGPIDDWLTMRRTRANDVVVARAAIDDDVEERLTRVTDDFNREMRRTDTHQVAQDDRITELEPE